MTQDKIDVLEELKYLIHKEIAAARQCKATISALEKRGFDNGLLQAVRYIERLEKLIAETEPRA